MWYSKKKGYRLSHQSINKGTTLIHSFNCWSYLACCISYNMGYIFQKAGRISQIAIYVVLNSTYHSVLVVAKSVMLQVTLAMLNERIWPV